MSYVSPVKSFEEVYKSSYSHGLESIYALENVDIRSIRPLVQTQISPARVQKEIKKQIAKDLNPQLTFDFGICFREWIDSFRLHEPIQVLQLSPQAEKILLTHQVNSLQDLLKMDSSDFILMKGLGQGHIDEINKSLDHYLRDTSLYRCNSVDFAAFLRAFLGNSDRKKNFLFLEQYSLGELFSLSSGELMEIRHLSPGKKVEWLQQLLTDSKNPSKIQFLTTHLMQIAQIFLIPWMRTRQGIVSRSEIEERLQNISDDPDITLPVLSFISQLALEDQFIFKNILYPAEHDLYCSDPTIVQSYRLVVQKAHSYFYQSDLTYSLKILVQLIEREFAQEWISFNEGFIEKTLKISPAFRIRKIASTGLTIKLA